MHLPRCSPRSWHWDWLWAWPGWPCSQGHARSFRGCSLGAVCVDSVAVLALTVGRHDRASWLCKQRTMMLYGVKVTESVNQKRVTLSYTAACLNVTLPWRRISYAHYRHRRAAVIYELPYRELPHSHRKQDYADLHTHISQHSWQPAVVFCAIKKGMWLQGRRQEFLQKGVPKHFWKFQGEAQPPSLVVLMVKMKEFRGPGGHGPPLSMTMTSSAKCQRQTCIIIHMNMTSSRYWRLNSLRASVYL